MVAQIFGRRMFMWRAVYYESEALDLLAPLLKPKRQFSTSSNPASTQRAIYSTFNWQ